MVYNWRFFTGSGPKLGSEHGMVCDFRKKTRTASKTNKQKLVVKQDNFCKTQES